MKIFRVSVIGKFSLNTLNKPSILRLSGVVSSWKNSLKDWICTSSRSGVSARCLILPKLILFCNFVEDILITTGFLMIRAQNRLAPITASFIEYQQFIHLNKSQRLISFRETDRKVMKFSNKNQKRGSRLPLFCDIFYPAGGAGQAASNLS